MEMQKTIRLLAILLVAQLALAIGLDYTGSNLSRQAPEKALVTLDAAKVDRLVIEGPNQAKVILAKDGGSWKLPQVGDFPADAARVKLLLQRLAGLQTGAPVATSEDALTQLKVDDTAFERRIGLEAGGKTLATLYFGTSPLMRLVHARRADQKAVYTVEFATFEAPATAEQWEDKAVLTTAGGLIKSIATAGLTLEQTVPPTAKPETPAGQPDKDHHQPEAAAPQPPKPVWKATAGLAGDEHLAPGAAEHLADLLGNLRIGSVLGQADKPEYNLATPVLTLTLTKTDGKKTDFVLGKLATGTDYVLKASTRPGYFRLPEYAAMPLIEAAKKEALLGLKPDAAAKPGATSKPAAIEPAKPRP